MSQFVFLTTLLTLVILFSTAVNLVFVAKLLQSGILFSNSVSFVFLMKSIASGMFSSNSVLSLWYLVFETNVLESILFTFAASLS